MTEQELIDLEVERRALIETVREMSKGDARMATDIDVILNELEQRAMQIQQQIDQELRNRKQ